jgi:hypothetical protein
MFVEFKMDESGLPVWIRTSSIHAFIGVSEHKTEIFMGGHFVMVAESAEEVRSKLSEGRWKGTKRETYPKEGQ